MSRRRRWAAALVAIAVVAVAVVALAAYNASRWIESHRDWVASRVSDVVGRPVSFGEIGVSVFPRVAVRVADVRVADDPAWSAEPFLTAADARVGVALLPALLGRVVVRRVVLDAPVVTVIRSATGLNVDSLGGGAGGGGPAAAGRGGSPAAGRAARAARSPEATPSPRELPIAIEAGSIRDGRLRLVDRRGGTEHVVEIHDVDVTIAGLAPGRAADVDGRAALAGADRQNTALAGHVGPVDLAALGRTPVDVELRAERVDVARLRAAVPEVAAALPAPLGLEGPVDATIALSGPAEAPDFDGRLDATRALVTWAEWLAKPAGVPLALAAAGRRAGTGAHLERVTLRLAELAATGRGDASPERIAMQLEVAPTPLAPLAALLPVLAARRVGGEIGMKVAVTGSVTKGRTPAITGTVSLRDVSVASADPPLDVAGITQTIALQGDVAVVPPTRLRVNGTPVEASGRLGRFGSPVLALSDLDLGIFGGRVRGRLAADRSAPAHPRLSADLTVERLDVAAAARVGAPGLARSLDGRLAGEVHLTARGTTGEALRQSLAGDGRFAVADGVLRGVNLADRVLAGVTQVPGLTALLPSRLRAKYPAVFGGEDTRFDELGGEGRVGGGVVRFERLAVAARDYRADGRGTLDFDGRLDATGTLALAEALSKDLVGATRAAAVLEDARGRVAIPFAVAGTWPRVRVTPDVGGLLPRVPGRAVEQGLERLLDGFLKR